MYISLNWIKEFVDVPSDLSAKELGDLITEHTAEVEGVTDQAELYKGMVIGKVLSIQKHPGADRLKLVKVDIGNKEVQIVCGGVNLKEDMLVPIAPPGTWVRWHGEGDLVELEETKIRGEVSYGMICAGEEIGLEPDNDADTKAPKIKDLSHLEAQAGDDLAHALCKTEVIFDIDNKSLTHRPDLWGHYGMAREVAAILKKDLKPFDPLLDYSSGTESTEVDLKIEEEHLAARLSSCVMTGITIKESPQWLKARLEACGMNSINNIVDITNYVMLEVGAPMHAFDRKVVGSDALSIRAAHAGEKLVTLEGGEHELSEDDIVMCNADDEALELPGVKGGLKSGISDSTTEIILESANPNKTLIRKTSKRYALRTDASQRLEKGIDPALTEVALKRAVKMIQELCPDAKLISPISSVGPWTPPTMELKITPEEVCSKIGTPISTEEMVDILERLAFKVKADNGFLIVSVPSHRATGDVDIPEDIVEEIARLHGYNQIEPILPEFPVKLPEANTERSYKYVARRILSQELGFTEVMNYSFYSEDRLEKMGLNEDDHFKILNYLSEDQTHMRVSMTPNMLATIAKNTANFEQMRLFEIGRTYKEVGEFMPLEEKMLIGAIAERKPGRELFFDAKGAFTHFMSSFRSHKYKLFPSRELPPYAHPKKCVDIVFRGQPIGVIFEVHPATLKALDIEHKVAIFACKWSPLCEAGRRNPSFEALPKFPGMTLDVSVVIDERKTVDDVEKAIKKADVDKLIHRVKLFDVYAGKGIPEGEKSLSFSIEMLRGDRTLTDAEFQKLQEGIFLALEKLGGKIRGKS